MGAVGFESLGEAGRRDIMIKTKIIATLGPSTETEEAIERLMAAGVDVFRMNFSHGELAWHEKVLERINRVRGRHRHTAAVLGDLCGPKIRTGKIEAGNLLVNQEVVIWGDERAGTALEFGTNYPELVADAVVGERLLINDGEIALRVKAKEPDRLVCVVERGGPISSGKGINLPDTKVSAPSITPQDWRCAEWAIKHKVDYLALSFVRSASDVLALRQRVRETGSEIKVVAKIEKPEAVADLEAILHASDAVMVARGDLGVEMDLAEVPLIQKRITSMGRRLGKPVIVATQMLQSMIANATPTRA